LLDHCDNGNYDYVLLRKVQQLFVIVYLDNTPAEEKVELFYQRLFSLGACPRIGISSQI
jgi:hypothetical protein